MPQKYFKHGKNKMLSSYGGIGSLVETIDNSVIIETFDNWGYTLNQDEISRYLIIDDRLRARLKYIFKNLQYIVSVPDEHEFSVGPRANYFPKWFYCPKCKRFNGFSSWKNKWYGINNSLEKFFPPKCYIKECNEAELEQVRFIMTCPNGHIQDIPWNYWNNRTTEKQAEQEFTEDDAESSESGSIILNFSMICCDKQELVYNVSRENPELSGIHIECKNCKKSEDLGGIFGFKMKCSGNAPWLGINSHQSCDERLKVVIKSSNSVYYSNVLSSIYIPVNQVQLDYKQRDRIANLLASGMKKEEVINIMKVGDRIPEATTKQYLESGEDYISEQAFREVEYEYFLSKESESIESIKFSKNDAHEKIEGFESIIRIDKLKQISVQTSFTRQLPIDVDAILLSEEEFDQIEYEVKRQSTSKNNVNTLLLPGIESYGEAILFVLDLEKINDWVVKEKVIDRTSIIKNNTLSSQRPFVKRKSKNITSQFILIHTLSHLLIIKELEYVCGYPAASLKERLYISDKMFGLMIMAIEGSEGSLGGLVSQCDNIDNLNQIINSALERAKDCSSDPICWNSDRQGVENLNLAACYSCSLLPDISCEEFNCFLDRRLLIDDTIGFFVHKR